jgi:Tol biopolymer transport system component
VTHGDSLIAFQYRLIKSGPTAEIRAPVKAPTRLILEKTENIYSAFVQKNGQTIPVGSVLHTMTDTVFTGLVVCSHDSSLYETAQFAQVELAETRIDTSLLRHIESNLELLNIESGVRKINYAAKQHFEAPNWSRDGKKLLFNSSGRLYTIPVAGGEPQLLNTDFADNCNNDHGYSPDGSLLAISHSPEDKSLIYTLAASGGIPSLITKNGPSYWHGWSPDGKYLVYCAEREGEYDVYRIPAGGGQEMRLTTATGLDDGPEYSPDGKYIYFNSERTGLMKIWRMDSNGKNKIQITFDSQYADWFPHPSPDGKWLVFLSYNHEVQGHPPNKQVNLRLYQLSTGEVKSIAQFYGGQGSINVPSWSPDSKYFAFVSYRPFRNTEIN